MLLGIREGFLTFQQTFRLLGIYPVEIVPGVTCRYSQTFCFAHTQETTTLQLLANPVSVPDFLMKLEYFQTIREREFSEIQGNFCLLGI